MTTTVNPEIGQRAEAGIRTNHLEAGSLSETGLPIRGSGPGVASYTNWRLVIPGRDLSVFSTCGHRSIGERTDDFDRQVRNLSRKS